MTKTISGRIHGRTIELTEDMGLQDDQEVRVQVAPLPAATEPWGGDIRRSAGCFAVDPEFNSIMRQIYDGRHNDTRREMLG